MDDVVTRFREHGAQAHRHSTSVRHGVCREAHALKVICVLFLTIAPPTLTGCGTSRGGSLEAVRTELQPTEPAQVRAVASTTAGLFVILGPTEVDSVREARREYMGWGTELVITPAAGDPPVTSYTLVAQTRSCVARARDLQVLWLARRVDGEALTTPVEAVALTGCDELVQHEWIAALDGRREPVRWLHPERHALFETESFATEGSDRFATYRFGDTELELIVEGSDDEMSPRSTRRCAGAPTRSLDLVRNGHVEATTTRGAHVGVLDAGAEGRHFVHLSSDGRVLTSWRIENEGLHLETEISLPLTTGACSLSEEGDERGESA